MARGINKVFLIGNCGINPADEIRTMPNTQKVVLNLSLATTEKWKDKLTGDPREQTEWHRVVLYDGLAEIARQYLRKGAKVWIEGRLKTRKWTDNQGIERYTTEIIAQDMQMLSDKSLSTHSAPASYDSAPSYPAETRSTTSNTHGQMKREEDEFDDIPF